ncbi:SusE domain-containing protein [Hymenobacter guriensis]|uniref:SusE domain-containing protein n=1 Tax=Hymenobacter guriensis TaxID=2793065 RepID=A0ABS0L434_9BACT|nr:SusE domain-containing protein [Hymenobacter guriensis]MBG8554906.1 SusE domain-containing protein [Hymenobacter guriensis]
MKLWLTQILGLCAGVLLLSSCEKDEVRVVAQPGTAAALTASTATVDLAENKAAESAVTFSWTPVNYGYEGQVVTYELQLDKKGNKFAKPQLYAVGSAMKKTFTVAELNTLMLELGLPADATAEIEARIKTSLGTTGSATSMTRYSAVSTVSGTPYSAGEVVIPYPSVYIPGAHQGWDPASAPKAASVADNKVYEGYVNFPTANNEFKFTAAPNWDLAYGDDGSAATTGGTTTGKLSTTPGGPNLKVPAAGYYLLKADLNTQTWSATRTEWGIIGSATAKGWDGDTPMTYDEANKVWTVTTDLKGGQAMKFRANGNWDINFGDNEPDKILEYGGKDIVVKDDGNYTVTLNLKNGAGNYTYKIRQN